MTQTSSNSLSPSGFKLYTAPEYRTELLKRMRTAKAGDRILLMTMSFEPTEPEVADLMREAELAASRGVHVTLSIDAHSFMVDARHLPGPLLTRRNLPKKLKPYYEHKLRILQAIGSYPTGHTEIINMPTQSIKLPVAGRSHIKAAIVNNYAFIGGCNLQGSANVDIMAGLSDKKYADTLYEMLLEIIHGKYALRSLRGSDRGIRFGKDIELLLDAGVRNQSLILDEALALIDSAEKWLVITCQFFPNSITAKHLMMAAKRGVKLEIVFSHPKHHGLIGGMGQHFSILRERTRVPKELFKNALSRSDPFLHAKLIACDKGVMIGSHNYVTAGVILGTAEIALKITNHNLARETVKTLNRGLGTRN